MSNVELHVSASNDLNNPTPIWTCTDADEFFKGITFRWALNQLGSAQFRLDRRVAEELLDAGILGPENLVRILVPAISATKYLWAIILDDRRQVVISRKESGGEELILGGNGPLAYLDRSHLDVEQYLIGSPAEIPFRIDPDNQEFAFEGDADVGNVLSRFLNEDEHNPHGPFLPQISRSFTPGLDSAGVAWASGMQVGSAVAPYRSPIGPSMLDLTWLVLDSVEELAITMNVGEVGAPLMELEAWQNYGRDLTGTAFAADVVLFREAVNVINGLTVIGKSFRKATHATARGADGIYVHVAKAGWGPGDYAKSVVLDFPEIAHTGALARAARRWLRKQENGEEEIALQFATGFDPTTGLYFPGGVGTSGHVAPGDLVSVKTLTEGSSSPLDYDFAAKRISGITMELRAAAVDSTPLRQARSWECYADMQVERDSPSKPGQGPSKVGRHHHPPNPRLCNKWAYQIEVADPFPAAQHWELGYVHPVTGALVEFFDSNDTPTFPQAIKLSLGFEITRWWARSDDTGPGTTLFSDNPAHCQVTPSGSGTVYGWDDLSGTLDYDDVVSTVIAFEGSCPQDIGHACDTGSSKRAARCDHVHAHGNLSTDGAHAHDLNEIEGSEEVTGTGSTGGQLPEFVLPPWVPGGGSVALAPEARIPIAAGSTYDAFMGMCLVQGRLHLVYRQGTDHTTAPDGRLMYTYADFPFQAADWASPVAIHDPVGSNDVRDPWIVHLPWIDRLLVGWVNDPDDIPTRTCWTFYSDDRANSWSSPLELTGHGFNNAPGMTSQPLALPDHRVAVPMFGMKDAGDDQWSAGLAFLDEDGASDAADFVLLADGETAAAGEYYAEAQIRRLSSGRYLCLSHSLNTLYRQTSTDLQTWTAPASVMTFGGRADFVEIHPGVILLIGRNNGSPGADPRFWQSTDEGATFSSASELVPGSTKNHEYAAPVLLTWGVAAAVVSEEQSATDADLFLVIFQEGSGIDLLGHQRVTDLTVDGIPLDLKDPDDGDVVTYDSGTGKLVLEASAAAVTAAQIAALGFTGPLLLSSDHVAPIVFDDVLQASDGSDFLYASEP